MATNYGQTILIIREEQGWTNETLGDLALDFILDVDPENFVEYLRHVQSVENGA